MEPISLATVTTAVVTLAIDAAKELAPQLTKDTWAQIKKMLGWDTEPLRGDLAPKVAQRLMTDESLALKVIEAIKTLPTEASSQLVGNIAINGGQVQIFTGPIQHQATTFTQHR